VPYWDSRPHATIVDGTTFEHLTELMTRQAIRLQHAISVLTVDPTIAGREPPESADYLTPALAEALSPVIRDTDVIGLMGAGGRMRLLLVGSDLDSLAGICERVIGETSFHRFGTTSVLLNVGGSCFPTTAHGARELLGQADALAQQVREGHPSHSSYRLPGRN
jgi:hypothetical protein